MSFLSLAVRFCPSCGSMTRDLTITVCSYCNKDLRPIKSDDKPNSIKLASAHEGSSSPDPSPTPNKRALRRSTSLSDLSEVLSSTKTTPIMVGTPSEDLAPIHNFKGGKVDSKYVGSRELARIAQENAIEFSLNMSTPALPESALSSSSPETSFLRSPREGNPHSSPPSSLPTSSFLAVPPAPTHLSLNTSSLESPRRNASWPSPRDSVRENHGNENFAVSFMSRVVRSKHSKARPRSTSAVDIDKMKEEEYPD